MSPSSKFTKSTKITSFFPKKRGPKKRKNKGKGGRPKKVHVQQGNIITVPSKESQQNIITVSLKTSTISLTPALLETSSTSSCESSSSEDSDSVHVTHVTQPPETEQSTQNKKSRIQWNTPEHFPILQRAIQNKRRLGRLYNPIEHSGNLYVPESTLHDVMKRIGDREPTLEICFSQTRLHYYRMMESMSYRTLSVKEIKQTMVSLGQKQSL